MKWSDRTLRPSGIFLDDDIYSEPLANLIRTTVVPIVLAKSSKQVGPNIKDDGIKSIATDRDLLIITRNGGHFRGVSRLCGGVVYIAGNDQRLIEKLVREVLDLDPSELYRAYTSASRSEIVIHPSDGRAPLRYRRR